MKNLFVFEEIYRVAERFSFMPFLQCLSVSVGGILILLNFTSRGKKGFGQADMPVSLSIAP